MLSKCPQFPWRNMLEKKGRKLIPPVNSIVNTRAGTKPYEKKSLFTSSGGRLTEYKNAIVQVAIKVMVINGRRRLGIVSLNGITRNHPLLSSLPKMLHVPATARQNRPAGLSYRIRQDGEYSLRNRRPRRFAHPRGKPLVLTSTHPLPGTRSSSRSKVSPRK